MSIESRIIDAYRAVAAEPEEFIMLTDLRRELADLSRRDIDAALDRMYIRQAINLVPRSNQAQLTAADREAGLHLGGETKHMISIYR